MFESGICRLFQQFFREREFRFDMDHFLFGMVLTSWVAGDSFG